MKGHKVLRNVGVFMHMNIRGSRIYVGTSTSLGRGPWRLVCPICRVTGSWCVYMYIDVNITCGGWKRKEEVYIRIV